MENQRKVNFLIVILVLGMHAVLFGAIAFHAQQIEIDNNIQSLNFVDLGISTDQVRPVADNAPQQPESQQRVVHKQTVKPPVKKVQPEKIQIKPVATSKVQNEFKVAPPKEDEPKLIPAVVKSSSIVPAPSNNVPDTTSANANGKSDSKSANGKNSSDQSGGSLVVPKEYQGGYLAALRPTYPPDSLNNGEEGVVGVSVSVAADGKPLDVTISKSSGHSRLDRAAKQAILRYRFKPATRGGIPIPYKYHFNINFKLPN
ncbi:energy transducer TonB [Snodgrassella alvi]|uniref:energy transducer TonB n=1 Tax=Snodgrassella alvi TaxID=1196083 RepID=UPI003D0742A3